MNSFVADSRTLALELMDKFGLIQNGWKFRFINSTRNLGRCDYKKKLIELERSHCVRHSDKDVKDTILHEIAHALHYIEFIANGGTDEQFFKRKWTGKRWCRVIRPHGPEWKRYARMVGADPKASARNLTPRKTDSVKVNTATTNVGEVTVQKPSVLPNTRWVFGFMNPNGTLEIQNFGAKRFHTQVARKYIRGRKRETCGKLFLIPRSDLMAFSGGHIRLYQNQDSPLGIQEALRIVR